MKAIVLAAGHGKRARGFSPTHKVLNTLYDERPIICHVIDYLTLFGFEPVVAVSRDNYADKIRESLSAYPNVVFSESQSPSGTAGEMHNAYKKGLLNDKPFLVYFFDNLTHFNY